MTNIGKIGETYSMPRHIRDPRPKGTKYLS